MPARHAVSVSWTVAAGAPSDRVTSGSEGRYMSIARGGVAVRLPRMSVTSRLIRRAAGSVGGVCDEYDECDLCGRCAADSVMVMSGDLCGMDGPRSGM